MYNQPNKRFTRTALSLLCAATTSSYTLAQDYALEEVIVTAQKRAESLQDVPMAVATMSGDKIQEAGIQNLGDLSSYIPNFSINETNGASPGRIFIRGVGSGNNAAFDQSVGMFIDGIYAGRAQQFLTPFLDVQSVEVLKGPQGTLFGKNTVAGAISIQSARPSEDFNGEIRASYETEYGDIESSGFVSGPLTDTILGRLSAKYTNKDGYFDNIIRGADEKEAENQALRGSLIFNPTDSVQVYTKLEYSDSETEGAINQVSNTDGYFRGASLADFISPREDGKLDDKTTSNSFNTETGDTDSLNGVVEVSWDMDNDFIFTSTTGYSGYSSDLVYDADFTDLQFLEALSDEDFEQFSQEFRIESPAGETIEYVAGVYYDYHELDYDTRFDLDPSPVGLAVPSLSSGSNYEQDSDTLAAYAQLTWNVSDTWALTGGLRWARDHKDADLESNIYEFATFTPAPQLAPIGQLLTGRDLFELDDDRTTNNVSPTVNIQWNYSDEGMAYTRLSRGYKSGGFNPAMVTDTPDVFEYDDEKADNIEVGIKTTLLEGTATFNVAAFYTVFEDRQVSSFSDTGFVVDNAAESTSLGMEMDGRWRATERLTLGASIAYLESEYDDFDNAACSPSQINPVNTAPGCDPVTGTQDLSGETTEMAPEWSGTFLMNYIQPISDSIDMILDMDVIYADDMYVNATIDDGLKQSSATKVNARISLVSTELTWELALIGKNLTDKTTTHYGAGIPLFNGAMFNSVDAPRTVAIEGVYRF